MLSSLLAVLASLTVKSRFNDPDLWWHIKVGQVIWKTHSIPVTDLFSFTTNHHAWIPHEWLAQLSMYLAWQAGGLTGLMVWLAVVSSALFISGYVLCSLYSGNTKVALAGALAIYFFSTVGLALRPQMVGYLLLVGELILIHLGRTRNSRWFLLLPPLFAVWINCHGSFFLGLLILAVQFFASFFAFNLGSIVSHRWDRLIRRVFMTASVLSLTALFFNPIGIRQILYPLDAIFDQPVNLASIAEWHPLEMTSARGIGVLVTIACILLPLLLRSAVIFLDEFLMLLLGTWLAMSHERMLFVFGILAAPILSRLLAAWWDEREAQPVRWLPNLVLIASSFAIIITNFPTAQELNAQVADKSPVKAVEFIQSHNLSGPMLNEYEYGGYLIWAAPERPVFVDGRADIFEWTGILGEVQNWATLHNDPNLLLDKYKIQYCLLASQSPMAKVMPLMRGWKSVYSDHNSVVFVRTPLTTPADSQGE